MTEKVAQIVIGPAGTGKTTYCQAIERFCKEEKRVVHIVNLDPAVVSVPYSASINICDLISLDDVLEERQLGPNGGLVYCIEYFIEKIDWFVEQLGDYENDYLILDCPGQLELYSHLETLKTLIETLGSAGYSICTVYLMDSSFLSEASKFITGSLVALSSMARFESPHVNVVTKMDILKDQCCGPVVVEKRKRKKQLIDKDEDVDDKIRDYDEDDEEINEEEEGEEESKMNFGAFANANQLLEEERRMSKTFRKYEKYFNADMGEILNELDKTTPKKMRNLNRAIATLLNDAGVMQFIPLDVTCSSSVGSLMQVIDRVTQFEPEEKNNPFEFDPLEGGEQNF